MTDEQTAAAIVADQMNAVSETAMAAAIVRALQQAREEGKRSSFDSTNPPDPKPLVWLNGKKVAPAGHIIDDQGVVRRLLGKLPLTADGCVFGIDAPTVYAWHHGEPMGAACVAESQQCDECGNEDMYEASECYSTREACRAANEMVDGDAAEAAKEAK